MVKTRNNYTRKLEKLTAETLATANGKTRRIDECTRGITKGKTKKLTMNPRLGRRWLKYKQPNRRDKVRPTREKTEEQEWLRNDGKTK